MILALRSMTALALLGCAGAPRGSLARARPSGASVHRALEAVDARASRCLGADDRVTVEGFFEGRSGRFLVERTGSASATTRVSVRQCVALAMEEARVRPFTDDRRDASWTVSPPTVSETVRAMMSLDASVATSTVEGSVDSGAVAASLRAELREVRRCYEDALRGSPTLRGRVRVRFTLSMDGRIVAASASGSRGMYYVSQCVVGHLRTLRFPAPTGAPVDMEFPFDFRPETRRAGHGGVVQDAALESR